MKMKFGLKQTASFLMLTALMGMLSGCGDAQSNDPLKTSGVVLSNSSLSFDSTSLSVSGTVTTKYTLEGNAEVTNIVPKVDGCTIQSYTIGTNNTISYTDNSDVQSGVTIGFTEPCTSTSLTLTADEINDQNITWPFKATTSIQASLPVADVSPIAAITVDIASHNITLNSEQREIVLQVRNSNFVPISEGTIGVRYPSALNAGIMNPIEEVAVVNGEAKFVYTAPSDISNLNGTSYDFVFFDTLNPLTSTSVTFTFNPDPTQVIQTEYLITSSIDDENVTMDLNKTRVLSFFLKDKDGNVVSDDAISAMSITLLNSQIADLIDSDGTVQDTTIAKTTNNVTVSLLSFNKSGLLPIEVSFSFTDVNGVAQTVSKLFSVVILSGPPTAFSMSYAGTGQDADNAKFIEHIVISAVDEYGNKVNRGSTISAGVITGYARDETYELNSSSVVGNQYAVSLTPIIDHAPVGIATIENAGSGAQLTAANIANTTIDLANDKLTTFRSDLYDYPFHASGKWDMSSVAGSTIDLLDEYATTMPTEANMGYVIGHNYRQEVCSQTGAKATAYVSSGDGTYKLDANGNAVIDVYYDYYLVAKTVAIYANVVTHVNGGSVGDVRGGETMVHTLRGHGLEYTDTFNIPEGAVAMPINFSGISVVDTPVFLRNSRFVYTLKFTGDAAESATPRVVSYQLGLGANGGYRMYNCDYDGSTFVTVYVDDPVPGNDKGGTVTMEVKNVIWGEF
ncbi:hypothetical protein [Sulfurimonas sp. HSL3-7]|uniref:hypothetical protein n=1 Tax=Sulfonitrofixus jiaomeiensis TaxID=3131938 RepID=UPI0031F93E87